MGQPFEKGMFHEGFLEVHEYVLTNVFPVMAEKRNEFNEKLTTTEIVEINNLIIDLEAVKIEMLEDGIVFHPGKPGYGKGKQNCTEENIGNEFENNDGNFEKIKEYHEKIKEIMLEAKAISDNHSTELENIMLDLETQKVIWKSDIEKILTDKGIDIEKIEAHRAKMRQKINESELDTNPEEFNPFERMFLPHVFILMDFSGTGQTNKLNEIKSANLYPNPATDFFSINYEISSETDLTIKIMDYSGNLVETINIENLTAGIYSKEIKTAGYYKGIYFIIFEVENGYTTRKILIEK
jgi:hypothetical protein